MVTEKYKKYLKSQRWKAKRQEVFRYYGKRCYICKTLRGPIQVHHRSYRSIFNERMEDVIPICVPCHSALTKFHRHNRYRGIERNTRIWISQFKKTGNRNFM